MRLIEIRKCMLVFSLMLLFIAKRLNFMSENIYEIKDLIYYCFLYTGIVDMGFHFIHITDFILYQCIFVAFLCGFYRDDILCNREILFTRAKRRKVLFKKETIKLVLNTCIIYVLLYGTVSLALFCRNGIKAFNMMYFLYVMLFLITYILLINVVTMLIDIKFFLVILLTVEVLLDNLINAIWGRGMGSRFFGVFEYLKNGLPDYLLYALTPVVVIFIVLNILGIKIIEMREVV